MPSREIDISSCRFILSKLTCGCIQRRRTKLKDNGSVKIDSFVHGHTDNEFLSDCHVSHFDLDNIRFIDDDNDDEEGNETATSIYLQ